MRQDIVIYEGWVPTAIILVSLAVFFRRKARSYSMLEERMEGSALQLLVVTMSLISTDFGHSSPSRANESHTFALAELNQVEVVKKRDQYSLSHKPVCRTQHRPPRLVLGVMVEVYTGIIIRRRKYHVPHHPKPVSNPCFRTSCDGGVR